MGEVFYGDLRLQVLYRERSLSGAPIIHLYDGAGMIPQFVIPNLLAAKNLRGALDEVIKAEEAIKAEEKAAKKQR